MAKTKRPDLVERENIIELLTDQEVASVSSVQAAAKLAEGDEFIDLEKLHQGVGRADGVRLHMGSVLARKAVREQTWTRIVAMLSGPNEPEKSQSSRSARRR